MYIIDQGHLTIFCIVFVWLGGPPSPVRIIAQVQWFMHQNRLEPSGGIKHLYKCDRLLWLRVDCFHLNVQWIKIVPADKIRKNEALICTVWTSNVVIDSTHCMIEVRAREQRIIKQNCRSLKSGRVWKDRAFLKYICFTFCLGNFWVF